MILSMVPLAIPAHSAVLEERVQRLELALDHTLEALHQIVDTLEHRLGPGFVGPQLARFSDAATLPEMEPVLKDIDQLVKAGDFPAASRAIRDVFGCTWDQALEASRKWQTQPKHR